MNYYIYKLKFLTPVHFGDGILQSSTYTCHADTLFSAICQQYIKIYGNIDSLIENVNNDNFLISDTFPYLNDEFYVPKPVIFIEKKEEENPKVDKKTMKALGYIPISKFNEYIDFLKNGGDLPFENKIFANEEISKKASLLRVPSENKRTEPFVLSIQRFSESAGLYFIVYTTEELKNKLDNILDSLSTEGLGGKRSLGYGKFEFASCENLELEKLLASDGDYYMNMSILKPNAEELLSIDREKSTYTLIEREGYIDSINYSQTNLKKKPLVMFNSGSCFDKKLKGEITDVSNGENHKVYRYGKPLYLGVKI
ncbi:MAG: type III-A CRISPR-associated RAMP protein Csm4 [Clostridiales bacterium]|nr:type III-A CRISPR-associated RAMP protein Csm4 [Clostridiales bacterium]